MHLLNRLAVRPENPRGELLLGPGVTWIGGVVIPLLVGLYALSCMARQEVLIYGSRTYLNLQGGDAILFALGVLGLAGLLHLQCFWDSLYDSTRTGARSKLVCVLVTGLCAYALCFRMLHGQWS